MEEDRRERFAKVMAALGEIFKGEMTVAQLELYYELLGDVDIEVIERNAWWHLRHGIFFPKPAELRTEKGVMKPSYHELYVPPWKGEDRWKALPEGEKDAKYRTDAERSLHGKTDTDGGEVDGDS